MRASIICLSICSLLLGCSDTPKENTSAEFTMLRVYFVEGKAKTSDMDSKFAEFAQSTEEDFVKAWSPFITKMVADPAQYAMLKEKYKLEKDYEAVKNDPEAQRKIVDMVTKAIYKKLKEEFPAASKENAV